MIIITFKIFIIFDVNNSKILMQKLLVRFISLSLTYA